MTQHFTAFRIMFKMHCLSLSFLETQRNTAKGKKKRGEKADAKERIRRKLGEGQGGEREDKKLSRLGRNENKAVHCAMLGLLYRLHYPLEALL